MTLSPASSSHPIVNCQACASSDLQSVFFVGFIPPVNTMPPLGSRAEEQASYPLELLRCTACGLAQIGLEVDQRVLFPHSYPYLSGSTRVLRDNFAQLQRETAEVLGVGPGHLVVDIGSNDGTLLSNFKSIGCPVLGIEPSQAGDVARTRGIETLTDYFNRKVAIDVKQRFGAAKLVTAANVFAHIGDVHSVIEGIIELLAPDGVFISESHYLLDLLTTLQYDTIYHEHLRYYAVGSLQALLGKHSLDVFRVTRIPTHGGSIRVYAARKGSHPIHPSVADQLKEEARAGITDGTAFQEFRGRAMTSKLRLMEMLAPIRARKERVYGVGAPSRASTLINYTGIDDAILDCVLEISTSHKLNKYMPGTRIPVIDESALFKDQPEYALLLSWHIADELAANLRRKGYRGKFIVPLPEPRIISS